VLSYFMKKWRFAGTTLRCGKGILLVVCVLLLLGTLADHANADVDWQTTTTTTIDSSFGYDYNYTAFGLYNETYYNLFFPLNYPGNLPLIIQFGGYSGVDHGLGNLEEDAPLCDYLASSGYAVLEFGYETGGSVPEAAQTCIEVLTGTILPWVESDSFPLTVNKSAIGLCGHSAGASAALGFASSKVASSVALTPYYPAASLVPEVQNIVPTLILTGQNDTLCPYNTDGAPYYDGLVAPRAILDITGGDHNLGVGVFDYNTEGTNATLKYVTAWFDATLKGNSTAAGLFTSSKLSGDPGVVIFQLDITPLSDPSGGNGEGGEINYGAVITYGITIAVSLIIIAGFAVYQTRKRRRNALAPSLQKN
jgi:hypothetical protein